MSDEGRDDYALIIRHAFEGQMKLWKQETGLKTSCIEFTVSDGFGVRRVAKEILAALSAQYPNSKISYKITRSRTDADVVVKTDAGEYIIKVKYDGETGALHPEFIKTASEKPKTSPPRPPLNAEFILHLFLKKEEQDAVIGDLLERYVKKHKRLGKKRADVWFCVEVARSLWPLAKRSAVKAVRLAVIGEWIRRMIQ